MWRSSSSRSDGEQAATALQGAAVGGERIDEDIFQAKVADALGLSTAFAGVSGANLGMPAWMQRGFRSLAGMKHLMSNRDAALWVRRTCGGPRWRRAKSAPRASVWRARLLVLPSDRAGEDRPLANPRVCDLVPPTGDRRRDHVHPRRVRRDRRAVLAPDRCIDRRRTGPGGDHGGRSFVRDHDRRLISAR